MTSLTSFIKTSIYGETSFSNIVLFKEEFTYPNLSFQNSEGTNHLSPQDSLIDVDAQIKQTSLSNEKRSISTWLVHEKTKKMIFEQLYFPSDWEIEKIGRPNLVSKNTALEICNTLFDQYNLMPDKISPTKEEGVYIRFDYKSGYIKKSLIIEIYNTLEIAAIVTNNDTKDVEFSYDIEKLQFKYAIKHLKKIS